ncbi:tyrosine-type recombinase/integrase [Saliphagus sp. GCM10025308]
MTVLRVFVRWLQSRGLVTNGLADGMTVAQPDDASRNSKITVETAQQILSHLEKYEYASLRHTAFAFLWHTGMRLGALRSIDLDDYHPEDHYVELHHRPETETPLKNQKNSEREVNLALWCCSFLDDYIDGRRDDVTDDYDRTPLFTTEQGRASHSNLRDHVNQITRPCDYTNECPHDREITECEATTRLHAARCPSSIAPHDLRRSSVTYLLDEGHREELVADRVDMSVRTMKEHYDQRTKSEKRKLRREEFGIDG